MHIQPPMVESSVTTRGDTHVTYPLRVSASKLRQQRSVTLNSATESTAFWWGALLYLPLPKPYIGLHSGITHA